MPVAENQTRWRTRSHIYHFQNEREGIHQYFYHDDKDETLGYSFQQWSQLQFY